MGTYMCFLLISLLLFMNFMGPSEQMNNDEPHNLAPSVNARRNVTEQRHQRNRSGNVGPIRRILRGSSLSPEQEHELISLYLRYRRGVYDARRHFAIELLHSRIIPHMLPERAWDIARRLQQRRDHEGLPNVNWARGFEDQLIDVFLHDSTVNRNPIEFHRRWRQLRPDLPNMRARTLLNEVIRLHERREAARAREERQAREEEEQEIHPVDESAPRTPESETESESPWNNMIYSPSYLRAANGYESEGAESSSSIPPYPDSPRGPR